MVLLNPSAPTFTLGVNRSGSADSTEPLKSQCSTSSFATDSEFLAFPPGMKIHPLVPPNTPEGEQVDIVELGVNKHLATRLGEGWKTTFPASATPGAKSKHLDVPLNKDRSFLPSHRSRSPSLPGLLPSDEARNGARPPRDLSFLFQRLATPSQVNGVPLGLKEDTSFDPFDDGIGYSPTAEQHAYVPLSNSQRLAAFGQPNPPVVPVFSYPVHSDGGHDILTAGDIGEGRNVYLPDLHSTASEEQLKQWGQKFGRVVSVKVESNGCLTQDTYDMLPDGGSPCSRRYAFIMFDTRIAADGFMGEAQRLGLDCQHGKETPHLKQKALEDPHSSNLYVAEIPLDATDEEMRELFHPGIISSLRFLTDDMGNRRGTAMVRLQSRAQAEEAIRNLDLKVIMPGCTKPLQVRIADSENQKIFKKGSLSSSRPSMSNMRRGSSSGSLPPPFVPRSSPGSLPYTQLDDETLLEHIVMYQAELQRRQSRKGLVPGRSNADHSALPRASAPGVLDVPTRRSANDDLNGYAPSAFDNSASLPKYVPPPARWRHPMAVGIPSAHDAISNPSSATSSATSPSFKDHTRPTALERW